MAIKTRNLLKHGGFNMSVIGTNVKTIIKNKGIKQYVVARDAGFSPKEFNNMLNGRRVIDSDDIYKIAIALDVFVNDLFIKSN